MEPDCVWHVSVDPLGAGSGGLAAVRQANLERLGFVNGVQDSCALSDEECSALLGETIDRLPGWIEEVIAQSSGEEGARLAAVS